MSKSKTWLKKAHSQQIFEIHVALVLSTDINQIKQLSNLQKHHGFICLLYGKFDKEHTVELQDKIKLLKACWTLPESIPRSPRIDLRHSENQKDLFKALTSKLHAIPPIIGKRQQPKHSLCKPR